MQQFIGTWHGTGKAFFPIIDTANYREVLVVQPNAHDPVYHYEQKTWRVADDSSESLLHWESGFIRQVAGAEYEWINSQNNGRLEILTGRIESNGPRLVVMLASREFLNDVRMLQSSRRIEINGDVLEYTMSMATQTSTDLQGHLWATLHRQ